MVLTDEERKEKKKAYQKEYNSRPEVKAKIKENRDRPEQVAKRNAYELKPEVKARRKAYSKEYLSKPENIVRRKAYSKEYESKPENKAKAKEYNSRPENIAKAKERVKTPAYKEARRKRQMQPEQIAKDKAHRYDTRFKILQTYSKRLSNSDIPCCNCCGETRIPFLAIDHIIGKKQMDSIPELVKIGYSSKLGDSLPLWLTNNNFPDGFQILCHNCNSAKAFYGKCPHERK